MPSSLARLPEILANDFPRFRISTYHRNAAPTPGDLCYVEVNGRRLYGHFQPFAWGAMFIRPKGTLCAFTYSILGVLRPHAQTLFLN